MSTPTTEVARHICAPRSRVYRAPLDAPTGTGKTSAQTDTCHGTFAELVPGERVVEVMEFETDDPAMRGEMRATFTLRDAADGGTDLLAVHSDLPPGLSPEDNALGWGMALDTLAALLEDGRG